MDAKELITARVNIREEDGHFKLVQSRLYYKVQSAIQDIIDGSVELFDDVPEKFLPEHFDRPHITYASIVPETQRPTDFEFRYYSQDDENKPMLVIWVGTVTIEDTPVKRFAKEETE